LFACRRGFIILRALAALGGNQGDGSGAHVAEMALSDQPKILLICDSREDVEQAFAHALGSQDAVVVQNPMRALALLTRQPFDGVYITSKYLSEALEIGELIQKEQILEGMPDGVVLLDSELTIQWSNGRLCEWSGRDSVVGANFYSVLDGPEILGPDFCPFHTALATGKGTNSTLRIRENHYFEVHAAPVREVGMRTRHLIVTVRDVTREVLQQQKLAAIHNAGIELADLSPEELSQMSVDERIELLKSNIIHHTRDLLNFDVVEIRLLDQKKGRLEPLLSEGMEPEAAGRVLYAQPQNNGVTGFVAATGKSYLCEDTLEDPLYLEGAKDAKSSLTVPLMLHDEVIGTFNVESPEPRAFTESDLQFLEIFSRDVAMALNTFELLVAEKAFAAVESCEQIHSAVALPVDEILNDAVNVMERYIGHESDVAERLRRILKNARDIKQVIQQIGQQMAPTEAHPQPMQSEVRAHLEGRRLLVVDADENVRSTAHNLLERYGCMVETAHDGAEAVFMIHGLTEGAYDVIIADIRLPDMNGYEFLLKLEEILDPVPLVLMTGFGHDPSHSMVKARQAGHNAFLFKPFRLDQLLAAIKQVLEVPGPVGQSQGN